MSGRRPPIALEHYLRLTVLAKQGAADLRPTLELADAVALEALLDAWNWLPAGPYREVRVTVNEASVRMEWTTPLPSGLVATVLFAMNPVQAVLLSDSLGEAAEFAEMTRKHQGGSKA